MDLETAAKDNKKNRKIPLSNARRQFQIANDKVNTENTDILRTQHLSIQVMPSRRIMTL